MWKYCGVGSRCTPDDIGKKMSSIANLLQDKFILRSGGCIGSDQFFESGCLNKNKEIYLADKGDFGNKSLLYGVDDKALKLAERFHPAWYACGTKAKRLMARNGYQVLGKNLDDPVEFLICWTPDGCTKAKDRSRETGGTGQAISIADYLNIPIFNMKNNSWEYLFADFIEKYGINYE